MVKGNCVRGAANAHSASARRPRARLFAVGNLTLGEALAPLEHYAVESGLLDDFGRDTVDRLILAPFEPFIIISGV